MSAVIRRSVKALMKRTQLWKDYALIFRELSRFPGILILALVFPLLAAAFEGFGIGFLLGFLQNLVEPAAEPFQTGNAWFDVHVLGIHMSEQSRLIRVSCLILVSTWLRGLFTYLTQLYMEMGRIRLLESLYFKIFDQLQSLSLRFYSKVRGGEIVNTLTSEINHLQQIIVSMSLVVSRGTVVLVYAAIALKISLPLSLFSAILFSLVAVVMAKLMGQARELSFPVSKARGQLTSTAMEFINGIRTVHAFSTQDYERQRFSQAVSNLVKANFAAAKNMALIRPFGEVVGTTILIGMIFVGISIFVERDALQISSLLTFLFVLFRLVPATREINAAYARMLSYQGAITSIENLLRKDNKPYIKNGHQVFPGLERAIELINVDFGYDPQNLVLKDINLTIPKGTMVALVGSSGAGKSTLADLIPRFYEPTFGAIQFDGVDLRQYDIQTVRRKMAIVSQDTFIFNASVRDNIAYGTEGADDAAVLAAARQANALEFIEDLSEGLDTVLGDRGVRLSGGQRQRIAIARALLRNPEILILDEATSALDSVSERLIQESIEKLAVGRTVIAIAHRLSTIANADKVVVMENGHIIEQGTYQDLLNLKGQLWQYHQMQQGNQMGHGLDLVPAADSGR